MVVLQREGRAGMNEGGYPTRASAVEPPQVALLTPVGRGALAVVGVLGPDATRLVARLFAPRGARPLHDADRHGEGNGVAEVRFGRWLGHAGGVGEDVVAVVRPGGDRIEVHCHGGTAAAEGVITSLEAAGARRVSWHHWLASLGEADWAIEVREALARVRGPKAARILSRQLAGAWDVAWRRLQAAAEADRVSEVVADGTRLLAAARVGLRLTRPWRVVLVGRVNVGKSSLVNALAGHARCIVTPVPGTTRDLVETRLVLDGWEIDLVDTAGLRPGDEPVDAVERAGIERAIAAAAAADRRRAGGDRVPTPAPRALARRSRRSGRRHGHGGRRLPDDVGRDGARHRGPRRGDRRAARARGARRPHAPHRGGAGDATPGRCPPRPRPVGRLDPAVSPPAGGRPHPGSVVRAVRPRSSIRIGTSRKGSAWRNALSR
ncbi:MAG: GTP-binding protein [Planctomycetia bacterium]|nr:GTP-binding protein [Planctomycetia bacterium]